MLSAENPTVVHVVPIDMVMTTALQPSSGGGQLLPGASALPPAIGSKFTVRNALIGGAVVAAIGAIYFWLLPPKKKPTATTPPGPVAGLFGLGRRRRRR